MAEPDSSAQSQTGDSSKASDLTDRVIGDFRLLRRLGVGGMAEVYLAEQLSLNRSVAVKILRAESVGNRTLLQRFQQEARAAGGLNHPNIVQVFTTGQEGDLHYIVQEYVQGQNLSQWFKRNGPPDFLTGLKIMKQVAAALQVASAADIVHRDIKPENIMVTRDGTAKVTDFGLAQLNEPNQKMNLTQAGTTMGTPWYMSPEQIQGEKLDHRSDQYSFGITCYHMFAGQPPFPGKNSVGVAVQHLKEDARPLSELRRELPDGLCSVIHQMMNKKPADRFASPEELLQAITDLENAPLRSSLRDPQSLTGWLVSSLPSPRWALTVLALSMIVAFFAGHRLFSGTRLTADVRELPEAASAAEQYARALLPPRSDGAWKAVYEYFPGTDEAYWSRLQLALHHLSKPSPEIAAARAELNELLIQTSMDPVEWRDLRFLAVLTTAYAAELAGETEVANRVLTNLLEQYASEFQEDIPAPQVLRDYHSKLRDLFHDMNTGSVNGADRRRQQS
ncbi:MAG: serine/threonine-protein kinase [Fuerstiella sp.]